MSHCKNLVGWLWSRRNLRQQGSKRNRGGESEGVGLGLDKPLDFLATLEERFSARLLTSDFGNSTITNVQQQLQQQRHCLSDTAKIRFYGPGLLELFFKCRFKILGLTLSVGLPSLGRRKGQSRASSSAPARGLLGNAGRAVRRLW